MDDSIDDSLRELFLNMGIPEEMIEDDLRDTEIMRDGVLYADYVESKKRKRKIIVRGGWVTIIPPDAHDPSLGVVTRLDSADYDIDTVYNDEDD